MIDTWKQAQIPLETVLKGIDQTFEKYDQRRRRSRRVNSLAYCHQAVLGAAEESERSRLPHPSSGDPIPSAELSKFLTSNAEKLEKAAQGFQGQGRPESAATFLALAASLRELAEAAGNNVLFDLEDVERRLTVLEDKMLSILQNVTPEAELVTLRADLDRSLGPARRSLGSEQIAQLQKQFLARKLLEQADLPRLSLFYL